MVQNGFAQEEGEQRERFPLFPFPFPGGVRGHDRAKKVNGRKRHLLVNASGLALNVPAQMYAATIRLMVTRLAKL